MKLIRHLIVAATLFTGIPALSYIPPYWMILSRTAENHGRGHYVINQDVTFNHGEEPVVIGERWIIEDEGSMRLEATGRRALKDKFSLTVVYSKGRSYYVDENGVRQSTKINPDFFEPYFHFRQSRNIKPILVELNIVPSISLKSGATPFNPKAPEREPEPYVRLSRVGGTVTYGIGTPTPASSSDAYPGLWIEQDEFVLRRIRFPSAVQVDAKDYKNYSHGLMLPKEREVTWNNTRSARIVLGSVSAARSTSALKSSLQPSSLNFGKEPGLARKLPEDEVIREFYTRLR